MRNLVKDMRNIFLAFSLVAILASPGVAQDQGETIFVVTKVPKGYLLGGLLYNRAMSVNPLGFRYAKSGVWAFPASAPEECEIFVALLPEGKLEEIQAKIKATNGSIPESLLVLVNCTKTESKKVTTKPGEVMHLRIDETFAPGGKLHVDRLEFLDVEMDKELREEVVKTLPARIYPAGSQQRVADTRKITRTITAIETSGNTETKSTGNEVKGTVSVGIFASAQGSVQRSVEKQLQAAIERSTGDSLAVELERTREVVIAGDGATAYVVLWVDHYRTGRALYRGATGIVAVPFQFKDDFFLRLEKAPKEPREEP